MLYQPNEVAMASRTSVGGALVRIHAGLEDVNDLRTDLHAAFERVGA
jgi:cystathionine beta-lyase/cystathionine gamma-synthase